MSKNIYNQNGASLVEVLLMISIFIILMTSSVSLLTTKTQREDLLGKSAEVTELIARARNFSVTGYQGDVWGIKVLDNNTDCDDDGLVEGDCIIMFKGVTYLARNNSFDIKSKFDSGVYIESSQINEYYFAYVSGWLSTSTGANMDEQTLILKNNFGEQKTVSTTPAGLVYYGD
jgi:hypothetical protein